MQNTGLKALFTAVNELEGPKSPLTQQVGGLATQHAAKGNHQAAVVEPKTRVSRRLKRPNERFKDYLLSEDELDTEQPAAQRGHPPHPKSRPPLPFAPFSHCLGQLPNGLSNQAVDSSASSESDKSQLSIPLFVSSSNPPTRPAMDAAATVTNSNAQDGSLTAPGIMPGTADGHVPNAGSVPDLSGMPGLSAGVPSLVAPVPLLAGLPQGSGDMNAAMIPQAPGFYNYMPGYPGYFPSATPGLMLGPQGLPVGVQIKPEEGSAGPESLPQGLRTRERSRSPVHRDKKARPITGFAAKHPGTSTFRGVSWHTQTGRWKAQIKVNGRDINLGRHKDETAAARAYDRAAICARGVEGAKLNFPLEDYQAELEELQSTQLDELAATLRGVEERMQAQTSRYHGVRLNKRTSKWEAYIRVNGKHVHLGCYDHEVAAAQAFDQAAIVRHAYHLSSMGGRPHLVTNFPPDYYQNLLAKQQGMEVPELEQAEDEVHGQFYKLEEKYVHNLVEKCREQGGQVPDGVPGGDEVGLAGPIDGAGPSDEGAE